MVRLHGDQWIKEEDVRRIVHEELAGFLNVFAEEVANTPARADGNLNARDFGQTVEIVRTKVKSRLVL